MAKDKLPWRKNGKFEINSCKTAVKYIAAKTGMAEENLVVHKTQRYLVVSYLLSKQLRTAKVELPGVVLYCLTQESFKPLLEEIRTAIVASLESGPDPLGPQ